MLFLRRTLLLFFISVIILGCGRSALRGSSNLALRPGDLLFQDLDCGPLCEAIEKVTTGYQGAKFSHIGIAAEDDHGKPVVIEAVSSGVEATSLGTFLTRSLDETGRPKVVVGRLKKPYRHLIPSAIKEALALKGKPYDKVFALDNDAYYCSELVYEIFLRANENALVFEAQPMTFKNPGTGRTDPVWEEYFSKLGVPVPEGQPGINPGGISRCRVLTIFYPYGVPSRGSTVQKSECFKSGES